MRNMNPEEVAHAMSLVGWAKDKYGHPSKELGGIRHRMVLGPQRISLEKLTKVTPTVDNPSRTQWRSVDSFSYGEVSVTQDSQIRMGSRLF